MPVPLRLGFEAAGAAGIDGAIVVEGPGGDPLAVVDVPADDIGAARAQRRRSLLALELAVLGAVLLLLTGPLLDWRRITRRVRGHVALTLAILGLLVAARVLGVARRAAARHREPPLLAPAETAPVTFAGGVAADFLLTALFLAGVVGLAASSFEQWRQSRRLACARSRRPVRWP